MFGWDRDKVIGRRIQGFMIPDDRQQEVEELLEKVRTSREAFQLDRTERLTASWNKISVSIDTAPILDPDFQGYFSIIRPVEQRNPFVDHPYFREKGLPERVPNKAFVAMPYSIGAGGFDMWNQLIQPITADLNLTPVRADQTPTAHGVVDQEFHDIATSDFVIADLTGDNANVFYEVGIAHALGIETVLLRTSENIPFNLRHLRSIYCDPNDLRKAREDVQKAIVSRPKC